MHFKCIAIVFLSVALLLQSGGILLYLQFKQVIVYNKVHDKLKEQNGEYITILLTKAEFEAYKLSEDEILMDGCMYDIRSCESEGGLVKLVALKDNEEFEIISRIKQAIAGISTEDNRLLNHLVSNSKQVYIFALMKFYFENNNYDFCYPVFNSVSGLKAYIEILSPPPQT